MNASPHKLAITTGDPCGVGPELIEKIFTLHPEWKNKLLVVAPEQWLERWSLKDEVEWVRVNHYNSFKAGEPSIASGKVALKCMEQAADLVLDDRAKGVVTGPISKWWNQQAGMMEPGQTEFFANRWKGQPTMAFVGEKLRIALVTWHLPLMEIWDHLTAENIERTIQNLKTLLQRLGTECPHIGVCGLNPHAGENGTLGKEEVRTLNPLIESLKSDDMELSGCYPADTIFHLHLEGNFDGVVALYHDQGLAPLKTVDFDGAANLTLGLPYVRTSPDHGTAYGIAGKGVARSKSFERAIELALKLTDGK